MRECVYYYICSGMAAFCVPDGRREMWLSLMRLPQLMLHSTSCAHVDVADRASRSMLFFAVAAAHEAHYTSTV